MVFDMSCVESGKKIWGGRYIKRDCRGIGVCVDDEERTVESGHKFGNASFI